PLPLRSMLFPYTTLFRSHVHQIAHSTGVDAGVALDLRAEPTRVVPLGEAAAPVGIERLVHLEAASFEHLLRLALVGAQAIDAGRSEEHTSELQSRENLVC